MVHSVGKIIATVNFIKLYIKLKDSCCFSYTFKCFCYQLLISDLG